MMTFDKKIHLIGSFVVCLLLSFVVHLLIAVGITLALGIAKELIYDKLLAKGTPEWNDFLADVVGVVGAVLIKVVTT